MRRLLLIALPVLICGGAVTEVAAAKGLHMAAPGGVTVRGSEYRYTALSPNARGNRRTVIARTDRRGGRVSRWWYLRGNYYVPAVAYDRSAGGLSADGSTLVLTRFAWGYPPKETRFAILNTRRHLRHPRRTGEKGRPHHAITRVDLRGDFSFDAISPDGSTAYLIHRYLPLDSGGAYISTYEVRALDLRSGKLLPQPIVDPAEPDEKMQGLPITRATSPDGRWAYTLYDGNGETPFIHALDTVGQRAVCVDLPELKDPRNLFMLGLLTDQGGRELEVVRRRFRTPHVDGSRQVPVVPEPLLTVNTDSFEVSAIVPNGTGSDLPWLPIGVVSLVFVLAIAWAAGRGGRVTEEKQPEQA